MPQATRKTAAGRLLRVMTGTSLRAQMLRQGAGTLGLQVINILLMLGLTVALARVLGTEGYGVYVFVLAIVSLLAIPAQFGLPALVLRETAKYQVREEWAKMRGIWLWSNALVLGFLGIIALVGAIVVWLLGDRFSAPYTHTMFLGMLLIPLLALSALRSAALRGLRHTVKGQLPEKAILPGLLILLVLVSEFTLGARHQSPQIAMQLHVFSALIAFALGAWLLSQHRPPSERAISAPVFDHSVWLRAALPLSLLSGMQIVNKNTDLVMLGFFRSTEDVGIYKVVSQVGSLVAFGLGVVNTIIAPYVSRFHTQDDRLRLQRLLTTSARAILILAALVVPMIAALGDEALALMFGADFGRGYVSLVILCLGQLANAAFGSVALLLNMTGHERDTLRGFAIGVLANVALNIFLIPPFGLEGAAVASAVSLVLWNLLLWNFAMRHLSYNASVFRKRTAPLTK